MLAAGDEVTQTAATRSQSLVVEVGGFPIRFRCDSSSFARLIEERYSGFLNPASDPLSDFQILLKREASTRAEHEAVLVHQDGNRWLIERSDFHVEWNVSTGEGRIEQPASICAFDSSFRVIQTLGLARMGGFLLHAAGSIRSGGALLFSGKSGAGKTTTARCAPRGVSLLSDDVSCVIRRRDSYNAVGTPFYCGLGRPGENIEAPVETLYILAHGFENKIEVIEDSVAIGSLLENILFFTQDPELVKSVFDTACDFVSRVPVRRLTFLPDTSVWDVIP